MILGVRPLALAVLLILASSGCRSAVPAAPASVPGPAPVPSPAPDAVAAEDFKNTIRWSTASEVDNFGFEVFRSESPDGPFERLNAEVIEGAGTSDEPHAYDFVDATIDPYKTYYYYVESIAMSGLRERFTPVGEAPAKLP